MYSKKIEGFIAKQVSDYLIKIHPDTPYWKGKHTWKQMVVFREGYRKLSKKLGFEECDQQSILKWGGINNFSSYDLLRISLKELKKGELSYTTYSRISSMSKLFSFYNPNLYFILDARVALTINYLISLANTKDKFIPFNPAKSRGGQVKIALIQLTRDNNYNNIGTAYIAYNSLVLSIFNQITIPNGLPQKPEIIEMALFSMAERISESYLKSK
jgi:hypothetical protein